MSLTPTKENKVSDSMEGLQGYKVVPLKSAVFLQGHPLCSDTSVHVELDTAEVGIFVKLSTVDTVGAQPGVVEMDLDQLYMVAEEAKRMEQAFYETCPEEKEAELECIRMAKERARE